MLFITGKDRGIGMLKSYFLLKQKQKSQSKPNPNQPTHCEEHHRTLEKDAMGIFGKFYHKFFQQNLESQL